MNVPQENLNSLADLALRVHNDIRRVGDELRRMDASMDLRGDVENARQKAKRMVTGLQAVGARDPIRAMQVEMYGEEIAATLRPKETPIHLLSSPAAQRYAEAIRAAAQACAEMERERGIGDGLAEILGDYADIAEMEVFGPVGLRGME